MDAPNLVAPGVRSFMDYTLRNCRQMKDTYMTYSVNIGLTILFFGVVGLFLYYKYKGKPTQIELESKKREGHEYMMKKLGMHVATRQMANAANASVLTGLPIWEKSLLIPGIGNN
jgi:hypothetical protein